MCTLVYNPFFFSLSKPFTSFYLGPSGASVRENKRNQSYVLDKLKVLGEDTLEAMDAEDCMVDETERTSILQKIGDDMFKKLDG